MYTNHPRWLLFVGVFVVRETFIIQQFIILQKVHKLHFLLFCESSCSRSLAFWIIPLLSKTFFSHLLYISLCSLLSSLLCSLLGSPVCSLNLWSLLGQISNVTLWVFWILSLCQLQQAFSFASSLVEF